MNTRRRIAIARIISPIVISFLKIHTAITGTQRSRMILVNEHNEILLVRGMIGPNWTLPGGAIEKNETPKQAAMREAYEETGIVTEEDAVYAIGVLQKPESPVNYVAHVFYGVTLRERLSTELHNATEIIEVGWFALDDLPEDSSAIARACLQLLSNQQ